MVPKAQEPEIIVTRYDDPEPPKESKISSFFSDLNADGTSNKKMYAIIGGVLGVAMLTIFMIDAFVIGPSEVDKNLDISKKLTPIPAKEEPTQDVAGADTMSPEDQSQMPEANTQETTLKKPVATIAPTATTAPTNKPDPTATQKPTEAPTAVPPTAAPPTEAPTPTLPDVSPSQ